MISRNEKKANMSEVLVSFDGSSPHCIEKTAKSRNMMTHENDKSDAIIFDTKPREHPKVNLPFFRNNRSKFNVLFLF